MKATGIVRRLDDLGRLVIPKEIRKIYRLKEGDSIEFFVSENNEIIIRKYEHLSDNITEIENMIDIFQEMFKVPLLFYGDDKLTSKSDKYKGKILSAECLDHIKTYREEAINGIRLFHGEDNVYSVILFPLVLDSHWTGSFILPEASASDSMRYVLNSYIRLLTRQISE